jgi:hypothetical protein
MPACRKLGSVLLLGALFSGCAKGELGNPGALTFGGGPGSNSQSGGDSDTTQGSNGTVGDDGDDDDEVGGEGCGDGVVEAPELCDGDDLNGETCATRGFSGGVLRCTASCTFDTSMCSEACGNGSIDLGEECDGNDLGGADCVDVGFAGGALACTAACTFDTGACIDAVCGDGILQRGEACDCGESGSNCTGAQLANQSCTTRTTPMGGTYSGGTLACNSPASCTFDEGGCYYCGDGAVDPGEQCDGGNLNGATCQTQGFNAGSLSCNTNCTFNTSSCVTWVCGNGICEPNEDFCSCPNDCPNNPNFCHPCQCGGYAGACYCDAFCVTAGDCCSNGPC